MSRLFRRGSVPRVRAIVGSGLVVLGLAGLAAVYTAPSASAPADAAKAPAEIPFSTITPLQVASSGIEFTAPHGTSSVAERQAAEVVGGNEFGLPVIEMHFAHCSDRHTVPAIDEDCWVVSLDTTNFHPIGGHPPIPPGSTTPVRDRPVKYMVVLVEPGTGKVLEDVGSRDG